MMLYLFLGLMAATPASSVTADVLEEISFQSEKTKYVLDFSDNEVSTIAGLVLRNYPLGRLEDVKVEKKPGQPASGADPSSTAPKNAFAIAGQLQTDLKALQNASEKKSAELEDLAKKALESMAQRLAETAAQGAGAKTSPMNFATPPMTKGPESELSWPKFEECRKQALDSWANAQSESPISPDSALRYCLNHAPKTIFPAGFTLDPSLEPADLALFLNELSKDEAEPNSLVYLSFPYFDSSFSGDLKLVAKRAWLLARQAQKEKIAAPDAALILFESFWGKGYRAQKKRFVSNGETVYAKFCGALNDFYKDRPRARALFFSERTELSLCD